jgi:hypothetical protein cdiviTM7_01719
MLNSDRDINNRITINETPDQPQFQNLQHEKLRASHLHAPLLKAALMADVPVWLYGEAGSGKSTAAEQMADELDLSFRSISLGPSTSKADLMGYRDATGEYRSTAYRETYEDGGVFLFDEIDNAHPSVLTILNNSIANNQGEFPDKRISRHDDTRFIAAANTIGRGATAEYVGRTPIDAATIDRFAFVPMDIDPELEEALVLGDQVRNSYVDISSGGVPNAREWLAVVRAHREAVSELGIRAIIGQRAALYGKRLAEQGVGKDWLSEMLLYKGMKKYDREKLESAAGKLVGKHQNKLRDSHPNSTISSSRHQSSSNMNTNSIPSTQTHLYNYYRNEIIQDLPINPNIKTLPNRDSNLDGDQEVERDLWFDVPDTKITVREDDMREIAYGGCLEEAKQFMLFNYKKKYSSKRFNREGMMNSLEMKTLLAMCWAFESTKSIDGERVGSSTSWFGAIPITEDGDSEISIKDAVKKGYFTFVYEDRVKLSSWESSPDRAEKVACNFESLSEEDVKYYVRQFESKYNFTPGAITMINWLMQNPEVNNKNR